MSELWSDSADGVNEFQHDVLRRVCGLLSTPMTMSEIVQWAARHDPQNMALVVRHGEDGVRQMLQSLQDAGLVKSIGKAPTDDPAEAAGWALGQVEQDGDVVDVPKAQQRVWRQRAERPDAMPYPHTGELFMRTVAGHDKLTGPIPNEGPPMEGARLAAAQRQDADWAAHEIEIIQSERERSRPMEPGKLTEQADQDAERHIARLQKIIAKGQEAA